MNELDALNVYLQSEKYARAKETIQQLDPRLRMMVTVAVFAPLSYLLVHLPNWFSYVEALLPIGIACIAALGVWIWFLYRRQQALIVLIQSLENRLSDSE